MTALYAIIGALVAALAAFFGGNRISYQDGKRQGKADASIDEARASAAASKAVAEVLAQPTTKGDVIKDLEEGKF